MTEGGQHWVQQDPVPVILARMEAKLDNALALLAKHDDILAVHTEKIENNATRLTIVETELKAAALAVATLATQSVDLTTIKAQIAEASRIDTSTISKRQVFWTVVGVSMAVVMAVIAAATYVAALHHGIAVK